MNFGSFLLLGDVGLWMDSTDHANRIAELKRRERTRTIESMDQGRRIEALLQENAELRLCLGGLISLLVEKQLVSAEEACQLTEVLQKAEDGPGPDAREELIETDCSDELNALAAAARQAGRDLRMR